MGVIPKALRETMTENLGYSALRSACIGRGIKLPLQAEGSCYLPDAVYEAFSKMSATEAEPIFEEAVALAHNYWRSQTEIKVQLLEEEAENNLNLFLRSELAGLEAHLAWARPIGKWMEIAGFDFDQAVELGDFKSQMGWISEKHWDLTPMVVGVFLKSRRKFAESQGLVGARDLYEYVTNTSNDVFGVCSWNNDDPKELYTVKTQIQRKLYVDDNDSLAYRLTRQTLVANGGGAPINW